MADLDVDLAELLLAALNGAGQELHYISPPAAEEDDSFTEQNGGFVTTTGHQATGPPATRLFLLLGMWNNDLD